MQLETMQKLPFWCHFRNPIGSIKPFRRSQTGSQFTETDACHSLLQMNLLAQRWYNEMNIEGSSWIFHPWSIRQKSENGYQTGNYFWPIFFLIFSSESELPGSEEKKSSRLIRLFYNRKCRKFQFSKVKIFHVFDPKKIYASDLPT